MKIAKFLSFWSQHNSSIIGALVALILILALVLAYRGFFSKPENEEKKPVDHKGDAPDSDHGHGHDETSQEEAHHASHEETAPSKEHHAEDEAQKISLDAEELLKLRQTIEENKKLITELQAKLSDAAVKISNAEAAKADAGSASQENNDLQAKIKDLEARLAEYEIISEDIADLARYRDENQKLQKQLEEFKAGSAAEVVPPQAQAPVSEPEPVVEAAKEPQSEPVTEAAVAAPVEVVPDVSVAAVDSVPAPDVVDEELMKEFAAAVESQKAATKAAEAGPAETKAPPRSDDATELMNEFENFIGKKG